MNLMGFVVVFKLAFGPAQIWSGDPKHETRLSWQTHDPDGIEFPAVRRPGDHPASQHRGEWGFSVLRVPSVSMVVATLTHRNCRRRHCFWKAASACDDILPTTLH